MICLSLCLDISSIDDLFDLYCLGDKYELKGARNLIKEVASTFMINQENWIHILKGIKKYESTFLFEDLCNILQDKVQGIGVHFDFTLYLFYLSVGRQLILNVTRRGETKKTLLSFKKNSPDLKKIFNIKCNIFAWVYIS